MRLQAGLREPAYEASVRSMLAGGLLGEEELNIHQNDNKKNHITLYLVVLYHIISHYHINLFQYVLF